MANKTLTYVDASVLIYAATKPTAVTFARRLRALQLLSDPDREFVASQYLRLEALPIASYFNKRRETAFYETFFNGVTQWANSAAMIAPAYSIACQYGLGALDALHIAAADSFGAEFVSAERPTKPIYRAYSNITSIY
ncbi:MAG: PIN domain-containing protein [Pyrinomonadaceae bacterium]